MYATVPTIRPSPVSIAGRKRTHVGFDRATGSVQLRETEIEHLDAAVCGHHDVGRLEVAVRDAPLMRGADGVGERDRQS